MLVIWDIRLGKGTLRVISWSHFACGREAAWIESDHAGISYVDTLLFAKEHSRFPVLIPLRQRLVLCFQVLRDGIVRWVNPCSTSPLFGTITDLAEGKSDFWTDVPGSQHRVVAPTFLAEGGSRHMFFRFVAASHQLFSR